MDSSKKALNLLGIATKAGKTASGEFMTEKAVKEGRAFLVLVSEEASVNTKKMFTNMCTYYKVPLIFSVRKKNWATPWAERCAHLLPYWTAVWRKHS